MKTSLPACCNSTRGNIARHLKVGMSVFGLLILLRSPVSAQSEANGVPPGNPFQALQRQIDELSVQLEEPVFAQVRIFNDAGTADLLLFGPSDDCTIGIDEDGPAGLLLRDPGGIRILNPVQPLAARLFWGPSDECSIGLDPQLSGLVERDPVGFRLLGRNDQGCRLLFGPTDLCTVEVDPQGPAGLLLRDPSGIRVLNPDPDGDPTLFFGPQDGCNLRLGELGEDAQGNLLFGMIIEDPDGVAVRNPDPLGASRLIIGGDPQCEIASIPADGFGMIFTDPERFFLDNSVEILGNQGLATDLPYALRVIGNLEVTGDILGGVGLMSSRSMKQNIRTIDDALLTIDSLRGVYFDWKSEHGGEADLGFVAEEVAEVLPEAATYSDDGVTPQGVKYANLVAVAVEGIKAQQREIDDLRSQNESLRDELATLRTRMDALASQLEGLVSDSTELVSAEE